MIQKICIIHIVNIIKGFKRNLIELYTTFSRNVEKSILMKIFISNETLQIIFHLSYMILVSEAAMRFEHNIVKPNIKSVYFL